MWVVQAALQRPYSLVALALLAEEYNQAATAARKAAALSLTLYCDRASSYRDGVTAQSAALEAERLAIVLHTRQMAADIRPMLALGGGWTVPARATRQAARLCAVSRAIGPPGLGRDNG